MDGQDANYGIVEMDLIGIDGFVAEAVMVKLSVLSVVDVAIVIVWYRGSKLCEGS